jgi:hypothetical protein
MHDRSAEKLLACCGLVCSECPALVARKRNDDAIRCEAAATWSEMYGADIKPEDVNCDGCTVPVGVHFSYWHECPVRPCCLSRGIDNCAFCADYPCPQLDELHELAPSARLSLDAIRARIQT